MFTNFTGVEGVISFFSCAYAGSSVFKGVDVTIGSELWMLCILIVGFGDIGGGVMFDLMERDLFGGNAGGRLELFVSTELGVVVTERLEKNTTLWWLASSLTILLAKNITCQNLYSKNFTVLLFV